ncbi:MAG: copper chaperone PCu(A)C [Leucobacter sp.]
MSIKTNSTSITTATAGTPTRARACARARLRLTAITAVLAAPLLLTGCGSTSGANPSDPAENSTSASENAVALSDGWAKAGEAGGMTGVFGALRNDTAEDLTIASLESADAESVELHETEGGEMREIEGDVSIPAGGSLELAPGADHIMLMGLTRELRAGDEVTVTVHFADGSEAELSALVKDYAGANEEYSDLNHDGSEHGDDHSGHDHGDDASH